MFLFFDFFLLWIELWASMPSLGQAVCSQKPTYSANRCSTGTDVTRQDRPFKVQTCCSASLNLAPARPYRNTLWQLHEQENELISMLKHSQCDTVGGTTYASTSDRSSLAVCAPQLRALISDNAPAVQLIRDRLPARTAGGCSSRTWGNQCATDSLSRAVSPV